MSRDELLTRDLELVTDEVLDVFKPVTVLWDDVTMTEPTQLERGGTDAFGRRIVQAQASSVLSVPVEGEATVLTYRSHTGAPMPPLDGQASPGKLELVWTGVLDANPESIREWYARRRLEIERFLVNNNNEVVAYNAQMRRAINETIGQLRAEELARRRLTESLPFPVARSPRATRPVAVTRRQVTLQQAKPASEKFAPEWSLDAAVFDDIVADLTSMATVLERMPGAAALGEEHLRNLLLGMLNTNYTGQVAGELFNGRGKTDIVVRAQDRNVFIGECKFYDGPKSVSHAVDQLLSYVVWRDTKAALLLFVKSGNFTDVVAKVTVAVTSHPRCQKTLPAEEPAVRSDYLLTREDDPDRVIHLAVLPFRLP